MRDIRLSRGGADCEGEDFDAHVRIERARKVYVDVFNARVVDPDRAHVESQAFPATPDGAVEAEDFLRGYGIAVRLWL